MGSAIMGIHIYVFIHTEQIGIHTGYLTSISGHFLRYPSDADKHLLARQTGLSRNQVLAMHVHISIYTHTYI